jgi:hypothetical protein
MADKVRRITACTNGRSMRQVVERLREYLTGWKNYFRLGQRKTVFEELDQWIRRRVRMLQLRQWKRGRKIYRELRARGAPERQAAGLAAHAGRWWAMSAHHGICIALNNRALHRAGIPRLAA